MANELVKDINDSQFENDVLNSSTPTLVDFWAEWCGPCKAIAPIVDELATQYEGKVNFVKVNIDTNQNTPVSYGVRGIPTLILFKDGQIVDQVVGMVEKSKIEEALQKAL